MRGAERGKSILDARRSAKCEISLPSSRYQERYRLCLISGVEAHLLSSLLIGSSNAHVRQSQEDCLVPTRCAPTEFSVLNSLAWAFG